MMKKQISSSAWKRQTVQLIVIWKIIKSMSRMLSFIKNQMPMCWMLMQTRRILLLKEKIQMPHSMELRLCRWCFLLSQERNFWMRILKIMRQLRREGILKVSMAHGTLMNVKIWWNLRKTIRWTAMSMHRKETHITQANGISYIQMKQ